MYDLVVLGDRVVVLPDAVRTESAGGLALSPSAQDRPCVGTLTRVGGDCRGLAVGDRVLYASWAGVEYAAGGQRWLVLAFTDIVGVLTLPDPEDDTAQPS